MLTNISQIPWSIVIHCQHLFYCVEIQIHLIILFINIYYLEECSQNGNMILIFFYHRYKIMIYKLYHYILIYFICMCILPACQLCVCVPVCVCVLQRKGKGIIFPELDLQMLWVTNVDDGNHTKVLCFSRKC